MEVQLRRLGPNSKIKILKVPKECRVKIWLAGRGTSCHIYTKSKYASRQHFSITYRQQKYFISDLGSANGTFLNDEKLVEETVLTFGSIISVGVPSDMQDSPDCIVFVFELYSGVFPAIKEPSLPEKDETAKLEMSSGPEAELGDGRIEDAQPKHPIKGLITEYLDVDKNSDNIEELVMSDSSSSDVVLIECFSKPKELSTLSLHESKPAKIKKLEISESELAIEQEVSQVKVELNKQENKTTVQDINSEEENMSAYEALTQVDEPLVKMEPNFLNYSQTEELIEISDSEDDWSTNVKPEECKSPEEDEDDDDDDDIVVLETVFRSKELVKNDLPPVHCKLEDELTEVDKKWLAKLLKIKSEEESLGRNDETMETVQLNDEEKETAMEIDEPEAEDREDSFVRAHDLNITPCVVRLNRLCAHDITESQKQIIEAKGETHPKVEVPHTIIKKAMAKKSVSFNLVPRVIYFEVPPRPRLTDTERGRIRFTRIIFNICNWNTHWLEECKRIAPEKYPPDICEERLRKIPKKFSSHSDYMVAFIPAMLHHLWNKIKDKWISSGGSGFKQTVSCDSSEDYHSENLSVYKCTGLVQSVDAHKLLIREGHLILLRLHQISDPNFISPATEKYSKKLGYLAFGFVESKSYERFYNQPLHEALAERCASIVGDLHIVRLSILIKKRPNFHIDKKKLIQLMVVQQISPDIRMFKGICFLPDSPLCSAILRPSQSDSTLTEPENKNLVFKGPVDCFQSEIIRKLSHAFFSKDSFIYSIHGAAGTGKGQVIIGLILQLLYSDEWRRKRPKIIYCTQWSIPLDEMVAKLKNFRQAVEEPFNLVRVGPIKEVKPEVRDLCVSNLASSLRNSDKRVLNRNFDAEIEVIKRADVICTTCISAGTAKVCAAFEKLVLRDKDQKIICIIDEAMSCKETISVIPLLLKVTHLLLVGDIYQLEPSFSGEKTHSLGLDMSLFWRIYKNFINLPKDEWPIYILKTQFRMSSDLSEFASQLVYKTPLQKPILNVANRIISIKSHLLLVSLEPEKSKEERENQEVRSVSQLMKAVVKLAKETGQNANFRFAVIACESKQTESLQSLLPKREFPEIEIGQIQAFQGREFDVVVFAYSGKKMMSSWLATGLTRARNSLFIFASEKSINKSSFFRKIAINARCGSYLEFVHSDLKIKDFEKMIKAV